MEFDRMLLIGFRRNRPRPIGRLKGTGTQSALCKKNGLKQIRAKNRSKRY